MSDHRSTSGFIFDIAGSSIAWSSKKQTTVATSSVEAEYIASANATKEAVWLHTLLTELDFPSTQATIIYADCHKLHSVISLPILRRFPWS